MADRFATPFAFFITMLLVIDANELFAQVIQLPSIETFSYSGSVLVPDAGTTSLGSVSRSSSLSNRGPRSYGGSSSASHSGLSASVQIIDLSEMDRQIRGTAPQSRAGRSDLRQSNHSSLQGQGSTKEQHAKALVRLARCYLSDGDRIRAKWTYQQAISNLEGELKEYAIAEYRRVFLRY
jgi:hypothetical protein